LKIGVIKCVINFQKYRGFDMHNDFTLFSRVVPSGKTVVYYYAYDDEGRRLGPWSTGQANKTLARNYCNKLNKNGKLLPEPKEIPAFAEFAVAFWDWDKSEYLKERRKRRKLTQAYADKNKKVVEHSLIPYFGKMKLDAITGEVIDKWLDYMISEKFANTTTNSYFSTIQTMLKWAAKKGVIQRDPFLDVEKLLDDRKEKQIITDDEFKSLFTDGWEKAWNNDLLLCTAHKLAALTGIRCCELLGLRGEFVFDDHIYICAQHDNKYGYRDTKTKTKHHIPLTAEVIDDLNKLKAVNGDGFLFSLNGGGKPVSRKHIWTGLRKALKRIGISDEEYETRGLNVHAWRHFCNTELQKEGLTIQKVQAVTGHKSERSTERYTHFNPLDFVEVAEIQAKLLKPKTVKSDSGKTEKPALTLVKLTDDKQAVQQLQAS
jgi:integrase